MLKARRENDTLSIGAVNALTFVSATSTNRDDHDSLPVGFIFNRKMFNCQRMSRAALQGGKIRKVVKLLLSIFALQKDYLVRENQKVSVMTSTFPWTDWNARREPLDGLPWIQQTVRGSKNNDRRWVWYDIWKDTYIWTQTLEKRLLHTYRCILENFRRWNDLYSREETIRTKRLVELTLSETQQQT